MLKAGTAMPCTTFVRTLGRLAGWCALLALCGAAIPDALAQASAVNNSPPLDRPASVALSPDGKLRATGGWDTLAQLWRVSDGALLRTFRFKDPVFAVAFSPDGRLLATGTAKTGQDAVKLWRVSDGKCLRSYWDTSCIAINGLTFSRDGRRLIVNDSGLIKRFRVPAVAPQ
jgi:WD40 repeat protein